MFIKVRDQYGNPPPACSHGIQERLWVAFIPDGGDGTPKGDGFTDNAGNLGREGFELVYGTKAATFAVNEANVNGNYETARKHVDDVEAGTIEIVVNRKAASGGGGGGGEGGGGGGTTPGLTTISCPSNASVKGYGTVAEWKTIAHDIVNRNRLKLMEHPTGPQPDMQKFNEEVGKVHPYAELQHDSGGALKPRFFAPSSDRSDTPDSGRYSRPCDFGDFGFPFFCNATSTDEWVPTGRPPGTEW
ncbi:MAG TPA: hypothetical protein VFO16_14040 [Pseudonocardiaceae bacterium]|nr:hypothetical protein [Pseudonocardiaceae bacterium]